MNKQLRNKVYDLVATHQKTIMGLAIFLSLLAVSVTVSSHSIDLIWRQRPFIAVFLVVLGLLLFILYIQIDQYRIRKLSEKIRLEEKGTQALHLLTDRQKQIYDLILAGKSNKEIAAELYIEQSTLKTHINQMYKKLEIKSRRALKNRS